MPGDASRFNGKKGGRPKGTVAKSTAIAIKLKEIMAKKLADRFGPIIDAQLDAAEGIMCEQYNAKTKDFYYKDMGPNVSAFKTMYEQVVGKPKETIELTDKTVNIDV